LYQVSSNHALGFLFDGLGAIYRVSAWKAGQHARQAPEAAYPAASSRRLAADFLLFIKVIAEQISKFFFNYWVQRRERYEGVGNAYI